MKSITLAEAKKEKDGKDGEAEGVKKVGEGGDGEKESMIVSSIEIVLSKEVLDTTTYGYQVPIEKEEDQPRPPRQPKKKDGDKQKKKTYNRGEENKGEGGEGRKY